MARERVGECFEALLVMSLVDSGWVDGRNLHWGVKPEGFPIDPDIVLGPIDQPTTWILATSSTSSKNSLEKFWRNIGELFEVKRRFRSIPNVVNCVLEAKQRDALQRALSSIVDGELLVEETDYGREAIECINRVADILPKSRPEKLVNLGELVKADRRTRRMQMSLKQDLKTAIKHRNKKYESLWDLVRGEKRSPVVPGRRETFVRRGLSKLMLFEPSLQERLISSAITGARIASVPPFARTLGLVEPVLGGFRCSDSDIKSAASTIGMKLALLVLAKSFESRPDNWTNWRAIFNSASPDSHAYVIRHYSELTTEAGMLSHLRKHAPTGYKWLFTHLMEILKSDSGARQGYGYSALAADVGYDTGISSGYLELSDWVNGFLPTPRNKTLLKDVARALAVRLNALSIKRLQEMAGTIDAESLKNVLEQKVVSYWLFEPLPLLILHALEQFGQTPRYQKKHPTFIGESLDNALGIAAPTVIVCNKTIICWRSAHDTGRHHKTKELSGRAQALRFQYSAGAFARRKTARKLILVVDGTFTQQQLEDLASAGWDEIFYPDEMDRLAKAIV